jgi:dolichol kinase
VPAPDSAGPARSFSRELSRKAIHLSFIVVPLELLHEWLPWPRTRIEWTLLLGSLALIAIALDIVRLHEPRARKFFHEFFGALIRRHEQGQLLGSTYLLIAALLAVDLFPRPMAAAAIGYTVLGDGLAALAGRRFGRTKFFDKSLEGALAGLGGCVVWAAWVASTGALPWSVALAGALVASLVEFLPIPLDDNLGMTLASGYAMKLLGVPL